MESQNPPSMPALPPPALGPSPLEVAAVTQERIRLLSWAYYISGGLSALFSCFFLLYVVMFGALSFVPESEWNRSSDHRTEKLHTEEPAASAPTRDDAAPSAAENPTNPGQVLRQNLSPGPPLFIFRILAGVMFLFVLAGWVLSGLTIYAGRCLMQRRHRMFILVMAAIKLMGIPFGTLLGICTILVLQSDQGRKEFGVLP